MFPINREEVLETGKQKELDAAFNEGVSLSIDVVQSMIARLKEGDPKENIKYVLVLDAVRSLLITIKK